MFKKKDIRFKLALVWLAAFLGLWLLFYISFGLNSFEQTLDNIISAVEAGDWKGAEAYTARFVDSFYKKKYLLQMNNATEAYTTFEPSVRQLVTAVKNRQESALEYAGFLREGIYFVIRPFSGP